MAAVKSVVPCTLLVSLPLGVWLMSAGQLTLPIFLTCIVIYIVDFSSRGALSTSRIGSEPIAVG